jgi:DNA-binding LacI/PurR family transcriptional regulator
MVAPSTRNKVLRAVAELNYQPNQLARSLRNQHTTTIGLILADILNEFHAQVAQGVQDAAFTHGLTVMLSSTNEDARREAAFLGELQRHRFRGLIIVPTEHTARHLQNLLTTPIVEVDRSSGVRGAHVVLAENREGGLSAVRHLVQLGHKRVATISGKPGVTTGAERLSGYHDGMAEAGLRVEPGWVVSVSQHDEAHGYDAAMRLLRLPGKRRPTAVFAFNNELTAGLLRAVKAVGMRVPDDISIVGFDDSRWARLMSPSLTVVTQPAYEMGYLAGERLVSLLDRPNVPGSVTRLPTSLIVRESTAAP